MQEVKDLGRFHPKWVVSIKSLPLGNPVEEEVETTGQLERAGLIETVAACTGPARF